MSPESENKADELIRLLGALGQAQEHGEDPGHISSLAEQASRAHAELASEVS